MCLTRCPTPGKRLSQDSWPDRCVGASTTRRFSCAHENDVATRQIPTRAVPFRIDHFIEAVTMETQQRPDSPGEWQRGLPLATLPCRQWNPPTNTADSGLGLMRAVQ